MTNQQMPDTSAERMRRIEHGLLPESLLRSRAAHPHPLLERMAYHRTPGVSIAVINDYRVEWALGYGLRAAGRPDSVDNDTLFQAASISKPVTAAAALRLVEAGRLDLDEDVNRYLVSWKVPANEAWQPRVTLRHLLSHAAGTTVHGFPGYHREDDIPSLLQVLNGAAPSNTPAVLVNAVPGTQFRYSGGGTCIVQQLLMDVTGQSFPALMRDLVLDPLGMDHSTYEQPLPAARARLAATAHPGDARPIDGDWHVYPEMAPAGLWTTAADLARFAIELQLSKAGKPNTILSADMVNHMLTPQVEDHIGLGPFLEGHGETRRFGHGGWNEGFLCELKAYTDRGLGAAVMINSNQGYPLLGEILRAIAREYGCPDFLPAAPARATLDPQVYAAYVGAYELKLGFTLTVTQADYGLALQPTGQAAMELHPESDVKFYLSVVDTEVTFVKTEEGAVTGLTFRQNDKDMTARKLE